MYTCVEKCLTASITCLLRHHHEFIFVSLLPIIVSINSNISFSAQEELTGAKDEEVIISARTNARPTV